MTVPVTMAQVRAQLDPEEPDYAQAAQLGPEALPHLRQLIQGPDPLLASKATYLASLIPSNESVDVLIEASRSPVDVVRVAAAAGVGNLPYVPEPMVESLLADPDVGVRKSTLVAIGSRQLDALRRQVAEVAAKDPDPRLREIASEILDQLP